MTVVQDNKVRNIHW